MGCYSNILWGTQQRRQQLKEMKYFDCCCRRCKDPTELGSHFSSLRCLGLDGEACNGIQVPVDPTSVNADWACDKCPARIAGDQVSFLVGKMSEEIEGMTVRMSKVAEIESLLEKFSNFLHPNHYHMFALKHLLAKAFGQEINDKTTKQEFEKILMHCNDLLRTMELLDPYNIRLSIYRADVLLEKSKCLAELQRREPSAKQPPYELAVVCLKNARETLKFELDTAQGKQMELKISEALRKIE